MNYKIIEILLTYSNELTRVYQGLPRYSNFFLFCGVEGKVYTQTASKDTSGGEDSVRMWVSVTQDMSLAEGEGKIQIPSEDTSIGECPVRVRASIENL